MDLWETKGRMHHVCECGSRLAVGEVLQAQAGDCLQSNVKGSLASGK